MKRLLIFLVLIFSLIAACSPVILIQPIVPTTSQTPTLPIPTVTKLPSATPTFAYPAGATPFPMSTYYDPDRESSTSPNHLWEVSIENEHYPVVITNLSDHLRILDLSSPGSPVSYVWFLNWFPDSSGFIMGGEDKACERCPGDRLIIYRLDSTNTRFTRYVFEPEAKRNAAFSFPTISWSPDNSQFAVPVLNLGIYILNRQAQVINKFYINSNNQYYYDAYWMPQGIFYKTRHYDSDWNITDSIYLINMSHPSISGKLLLASDAFPSIVSFDPFSPRLLIHQDSNPKSQDSMVESIIFNYQTKQFEKVIFNSYSYIYYANSDDSEETAILGNSEGDNLYLFYWKTEQLVDQHKHAVFLREWNPNLKAFIVTCFDFKGHEWTEAISP